MVNIIPTFNIKQISISYLLIMLLFFSSCDKPKTESFCQIYIAVETDEFFQGSTIPISVQAGGGVNSENKVQLFINNQDMGFIPTDPYKYYWNTEDISTGDQTIKAICTSSENPPITDELIINLVPVRVNCPSEVLDIDENSYPVVQIGNQCWMKENLKTTRYSDGEPLINGIDSLVGPLPNELPGWYFAYERDVTNEDSFGYLYTWTTATRGRAVREDSEPIQGICPEGWHLPSVNEWIELIDFVGGVEIAGNKLKDTSMLYWTDNLVVTGNTSGFTALPGGCRSSFGNYLGIMSQSYFWTATETIPNHAYHIYLSKTDMAFILGHVDSKRFGYSVRCVKD